MPSIPPPMSPEAYHPLGQVARIQAHPTALLVRLHYTGMQLTQLPMVYRYEAYTYIPYAVARWQQDHDEVTLVLRHLTDRWAAQSFKKTQLFVQQALAEALLRASQHPARWIGYEVDDAQHGALGRVVACYERAPQRLLALDHQGKELLLPLHEALVQAVDDKAQRLQVSLPAGYLDSAS